MQERKNFLMTQKFFDDTIYSYQYVHYNYLSSKGLLLIWFHHIDPYCLMEFCRGF